MYCGPSPEHFREITNNYFNPRLLRSSYKNLLAEPLIQSKAYDERTLNFATPFIWNSFSEEFRKVTSIILFKKKEKI